MNQLFRLTRFLILAVFLAVFAFGASAQSGLSDYWEKADNERQPPDQVMDALGIKPGMVIGEVGAGRGRYTVLLASRVGPAGKVYAEDINSSSLDYLRERLKKAEISNTEVILGEVNDPLFPDGALDAVIMVLTYHHLAQPVELLKNLIPSLKPGAIVAILDPDAKKGSRHARERIYVPIENPTRSAPGGFRARPVRGFSSQG